MPYSSHFTPSATAISPHLNSFKRGYLIISLFPKEPCRIIGFFGQSMEIFTGDQLGLHLMKSTYWELSSPSVSEYCSR